MPQSKAFSIFCVALTVIALLIAASIAVLYGRVRPEFALNATPAAALALVALKRVASTELSVGEKCPPECVADEFDKAWEERPMFLLTTHPHIIGHRPRIVALEGLIEHMQPKDGVWFATHEQVARYVREKSGTK